MAAYNFRKEFVPQIRRGEKDCTIRARRKGGYLPKVGERLSLYVGMRTKGCKRIRTALVRAVTPIVITTFEDRNRYGCLDGIILDGKSLDGEAMRALVKRDGFNSTMDFANFFRLNHGSDARLYLIEWWGRAEPRSEKWIKRNLPSYQKDNEFREPEHLQSLLAMVIHDALVPLEMIASWTPTQRLLADDWAYNVHLRASDNINRVPAKPDFLKEYE